MNLGLDEVGGAVLVISQFTLYGDTAKGRRRYEQIRNARTDAVSLAIAGLTDAERRRLAAALPVLESLAATLRDGRA